MKQGFGSVQSGVKWVLSAATALLMVSGLAQAKDGTVDPAISKQILQQLSAGRDDLQFNGVKASPVKGIYQVDVINGPTLYVSEDGKHFIAGDLFRVEPQGYVNLQEQQRESMRAELLAQVPMEDQIIFKAKGKTKAHISVFTDIDCGYCAKLHREVPALNEMGIEVRYLAYPRAGLQSASYQKIATAWCAENPQETLTSLKNREPVTMAVCEDNPVAGHLALGMKIGVRGTPALVTESGALLPGYVPADQLAATLGVN